MVITHMGSTTDDFGTLPASQECPIHFHFQHHRALPQNLPGATALGRQLGTGLH